MIREENESVPLGGNFQYKKIISLGGGKEVGEGFDCLFDV